MDKKDQRRIINELCDGVRDTMLDNLHKVPKEWDGQELRHWMKDIVDTGVAYLPMERSRVFAFKSALLTLGL